MHSLAIVAGYLLLVAGVLLSLFAFRHDVHRLRIARDVPQAAPKRIAPEVHAIAAVIAACGVGFVWGVLGGGGWLIAHVVLTYFVVRPLIERR